MSTPHFFKAKAIRRDNGQWVSGYFIGYNNTIVTTTHNGKVVPYVSSFVSYFVYPETVCYFTGLLDKNAREVYSKDTLLAEKVSYAHGRTDSFNATVEYESGSFILNVETNVFMGKLDLRHFKNIILTGNIFDNYKPATLENNE